MTLPLDPSWERGVVALDAALALLSRAERELLDAAKASEALEALARPEATAPSVAGLAYPDRRRLEALGLGRAIQVVRSLRAGLREEGTREEARAEGAREAPRASLADVARVRSLLGAPVASSASAELVPGALPSDPHPLSGRAPGGEVVGERPLTGRPLTCDWCETPATRHRSRGHGSVRACAAHEDLVLARLDALDESARARAGESGDPYADARRHLAPAPDRLPEERAL